MVLCFSFPGNEIQRKWEHIHDNFRNEAQLKKKVASGQGAIKGLKSICCDQFLLPTMQERGTSGSVTPPSSVNENEAQDVTTEHREGEASHAKDVTYRLQSNI
jgi:hypothetical protein